MKHVLLFVACAVISQAAYVATPCNQCEIQSSSHMASGSELAPLTDQLFSNWSGVTSTYSVSNVRANDGGFLAGSYSTQGITSSFVYNASAGTLLCCVFDTLFRIEDLNNNLVVGYDNRGAFIGQLDILNTNNHPLALTFHNNFTLTTNSMFAKIDDRDNILLFQDGHSYLLTEAPEPATLGMLLSGLGVLVLRRVIITLAPR